MREKSLTKVHLGGSEGREEKWKGIGAHLSR